MSDCTLNEKIIIIIILLLMALAKQKRFQYISAPGKRYGLRRERKHGFA